jgi:hypothetical protein
MPRPFIDAAALLGAHGHRLTEPTDRQSIWSRHAMTPAPYALLKRLDERTRPTVFVNLAALAAHIERQRHGQSLELVEVEDLHFLWRNAGGGAGIDAPERDLGVQIWTRLLDGSRDRCLGWAWLNGAGLEVLQQALMSAAQRAERPASQHRLSDTLRARIAYRELVAQQRRGAA